MLTQCYKKFIQFFLIRKFIRLLIIVFMSFQTPIFCSCSGIYAKFSDVILFVSFTNHGTNSVSKRLIIIMIVFWWLFNPSREQFVTFCDCFFLLFEKLLFDISRRHTADSFSAYHFWTISIFCTFSMSRIRAYHTWAQPIGYFLLRPLKGGFFLFPKRVGGFVYWAWLGVCII